MLIMTEPMNRPNAASNPTSVVNDMSSPDPYQRAPYLTNNGSGGVR